MERIRRRHPIDFRRERAETFLEQAVLARHRQCEVGTPMIPALKDDHGGAIGVAARHLDRRLSYDVRRPAPLLCLVEHTEREDQVDPSARFEELRALLTGLPVQLLSVDAALVSE